MDHEYSKESTYPQKNDAIWEKFPEIKLHTGLHLSRYFGTFAEDKTDGGSVWTERMLGKEEQ